MPEDARSERLLQKASEAFEKGEKEKALRCAIEGLKFNPSTKQATELNLTAAKILAAGGTVNRAYPHAEKALELARKSGDRLEIYHSVFLMGKILAHMNRYDEARSAWEEALKIARDHENLRFEGRVLLNMAILEQRRGNHENALELLEESEKCSTKADDIKTLVTCYGRMIYVYVERNQIEPAFESARKLEELAQKTGLRNLLAVSYFRKGHIYLKSDDFQNALEPLKQAAAIFKELDDKKNYAMSLCNISRAHIGLRETDKINPLLIEAMDLAQGIESQTVMSAVNLILAEVSVHNGSTEKAMNYYLEALRFAEEVGTEDRFQIVHESISETLMKPGFNIPGLKPFLERTRRSYVKLGLSRETKEVDSWLAQIDA